MFVLIAIFFILVILVFGWFGVLLAVCCGLFGPAGIIVAIIVYVLFASSDKRRR